MREGPSPGQNAVAWSQLVGWGLVAIVGAVARQVVSSPDGGGDVGAQLLDHVFATGHLLFLGLLSFVAVDVWRASGIGHGRGVPRSWVALALVAVAVAFVMLGDEFASFESRQREAGSAVPWATLLPIAAAASVPVATVVWSRWGRLPRTVGIVVGLGLAAGAQYPTLDDYSGVRFFVSWHAALAFAVVVARTSPSWPRQPALRGLGLLGVLAVSASVFVRPPDAVVNRMLRAGSVLAPLLAREVWAQSASANGAGAGDEAVGRPEWFESTKDRPAVPPSKPGIGVDRPVVILLTIDALRADLLEREQYRKSLPALFALRDQALHFTRARTPSPGTGVTMTSMFTGKYYSQLYWSGPSGSRTNAYKDESVRFPMALTRAGVKTVMVTRGSVTKPGELRHGFGVEVLTPESWSPAKETMPVLLEQLKRHGGGPSLFHTHLLDAHAPYTLAGKKRTPFDSWLAELNLVDRQLAKLRAFLRESGLDKRTVLIVTSDHGEAFGEHGTKYHSTTVYDELLRVPLLVAGPGIEPRREDERVSLIDIGPTILDLFGVPTPGTYMGQSLLPTVLGRDQTLTRPIVADSGRRLQAIVFPDGIKVIVDVRHGTSEAFNLNDDPKELHPIHAPRHVAAVRRFFDVHTLKRKGYEVPWRRF